MALASALLQVMTDAVRKTARPMLRDFGEVSQLQVSRKGPGDFVTAADLKAEDTLFELLMKARPGYGFLGEERGMVEGTDKSHTWIVDPIDGTTNFMHAMPHFAITVGLERRAPDGSSEIVAGMVARSQRLPSSSFGRNSRPSWRPATPTPAVSSSARPRVRMRLPRAARMAASSQSWAAP